MNAPASVYVVTSGEYSSYGISAIFTTRALAEAFVASGRGDEIEVWPLFDRAPTEATEYVAWQEVARDGELGNAGETVRTVSEASSGRLPGRPVLTVTERPNYFLPVDYRTARAQPRASWSVEARVAKREEVARAVQEKVAELRARALGVA